MDAATGTEQVLSASFEQESSAARVKHAVFGEVGA
jgi:hypothetical protein